MMSVEIPVELVVGLALLGAGHIGTMLWWGGKTTTMLHEHERRLNEGAETFADHDKRIRRIENHHSPRATE